MTWVAIGGGRRRRPRRGRVDLCLRGDRTTFAGRASPTIRCPMQRPSTSSNRGFSSPTHQK